MASAAIVGAQLRRRPASTSAWTSGGVSASRCPPSFSLISAAQLGDVVGRRSAPGSSTSRCSTRPVSVIMTSISRVVEIGTSSRWRTRRAGQARVLHDGDLPGQLGEQPHRAVHHVVEVDRADQEPLDRPALGRGERLDPGEPVDEQPVALVGGHPAGAGVRLADVALLLQHGHVVADRGRARRRAGAARPGPCCRPAPGWRRSPRRSRAARRACGRRAPCRTSRRTSATAPPHRQPPGTPT